MSLFTIVEDSHVHLHSGGLYKQTELYEKDGIMYAKWGAGFIGLRHGGVTTISKVRWDSIITVREWKIIKLGRMELIPLPKKKTNDDHQQVGIIEPISDKGHAPIKASSSRRKPRAK
jgi:DNA-binding cell septation regulator SpoVG